MANEKNLIPLNERSKEDAKRIQQQGGVAASAARRRKKSLKEAAELYLSLPVADKRKFKKAARRYVPAEDIDNQMAMVIGLTDAATEGDSRAARLLYDILGHEDIGENDALRGARELLGGVGADGAIK